MIAPKPTPYPRGHGETDRQLDVKDSLGQALHIGDEVAVIARGRPRARILRFFTDIRGGLLLDKRVAGFQCWNALDLVKHTTRRRK